jgi:hypothetical protein
MYLADDLQKRLNFIDETYRYNDYKPFFTDMWDTIILAGKHALLRFELFRSLQRTYSWMKYYNSELDGKGHHHPLTDRFVTVENHRFYDGIDMLLVYVE